MFILWYVVGIFFVVYGIELRVVYMLVSILLVNYNSSFISYYYCYCFYFFVFKLKYDVLCFKSIEEMNIIRVIFWYLEKKNMERDKLGKKRRVKS